MAILFGYDSRLWYVVLAVALIYAYGLSIEAFLVIYTSIYLLVGITLSVGSHGMNSFISGQQLKSCFSGTMLFENHGFVTEIVESTVAPRS